MHSVILTFELATEFLNATSSWRDENSCQIIYLVSMIVSLCAVLFQGDVLDEIFDVIESVLRGFYLLFKIPPCHAGQCYLPVMNMFPCMQAMQKFEMTV